MPEDPRQSPRLPARDGDPYRQPVRATASAERPSTTTAVTPRLRYRLVAVWAGKTCWYSVCVCSKNRGKSEDSEGTAKISDVKYTAAAPSKFRTATVPKRWLRASLTAALLLALPQARAQIADWRKVLHDVANDQDRPAQDGAGKLISETLLPTLQTENTQSLEKDLASIGALLDDKDPQIRIKASAVLWALTILRQDTTEPLKGILPTLISHFHDPDPRARENVARAVAGLRPSIPAEALRELLPLIHDTDRIVQGVAIYGITRSVPQSPEARNALLEVLSESDVAVKVDALKDVGFVRLQDPAIIGKLRQLLSDKDRSVVLATIVALDYAGSAAAPARPELQKIAENGGADSELAKAAASAIAKIDRH